MEYDMGNNIRFFLLALIILSFIGCSQTGGFKKSIKKEIFGKTADAEQVDLYTLTNGNGIEVKIINYGAIVVSLSVPDKNGNMGDVVLGYKTLEGYINDKSYFGAIVGRVGNRIAKGRFVLDGNEYILAQNDGTNHLHGGIKGFNKVVWNAEIIQNSDDPCLQLTYFSKDGEEGYQPARYHGGLYYEPRQRGKNPLRRLGRWIRT